MSFNELMSLQAGREARGVRQRGGGHGRGEEDGGHRQPERQNLIQDRDR